MSHGITSSPNRLLAKARRNTISVTCIAAPSEPITTFAVKEPRCHSENHESFVSS